MTKTINSPSASKFPKDNEQFPLRPAPIPYLDPDIDEAPLGPAPIPYLKPSPGEETDENGEGGDNDGTEIDTGDEQDDTDNIEEKVIGVDERIQIKPTTSQPYRWICHIRIQTGNKRYIGSGFLVNIPGSTTGCILTAGHNLWMETRRYADSLEVTFPGRDVINISEPTNRASRLHYIVSPQYKQRFDRYHDYGVIILPGYQRKGFGYSAVITDADLKAATAVVFGYPGDKLQNTMWGTGGKFSTVEQMQLRYTLDTAGGQSGCPVYIWYEGYWTVVGIHVVGTTTVNSATRLTVEKMREVLGWLKHPLYGVNLRAWSSDQAMLKIGTGVQSFTYSGSGEVKVRYSPDQYTDLVFIPLASTPQSVPVAEEKILYAISSLAFTNTYLRLSGHQLYTDKTAKPFGGGQVNCQFSVGLMEMFQITCDDNVPGAINIQSVKYPGVFLRMNHRLVSSSSQDGPPDSVNAQWGSGDYERFQGFNMDNGGPEEPDDYAEDADLRQQIAHLEQQLTDKIKKLEAAEAGLGKLSEELDRTKVELASTKAALEICQKRASQGGVPEFLMDKNIPGFAWVNDDPNSEFGRVFTRHYQTFGSSGEIPIYCNVRAWEAALDMSDWFWKGGPRTRDMLPAYNATWKQFREDFTGVKAVYDDTTHKWKSSR